MSTIKEDIVEIPIVLRLNRNLAEVARMLAICYTDNDTVKGDDIFSNFISEQVTKIIKSLAADPPEPPVFPTSLRQLLKSKMNESTSNKKNNKDLEDLN